MAKKPAKKAAKKAAAEPKRKTMKRVAKARSLAMKRTLPMKQQQKKAKLADIGATK